VVLGIAGGTGPQGRGLALRLAAAGHRVLLGSRAPERAAEAAARLQARLERAGHTGGPAIAGVENCDAMRDASVVLLTVPFDALESLLTGCGALLAGKTVIDVVNPLTITADRVSVTPVPEKSASAHVQRLVPSARVVAAFKNVAAKHLLALEAVAEGDVLLASDHADAKTTAAALVREIPILRPIDAGPLANAGFLESITALELSLNRLHTAHTAIRILGLD
jgi:NADPH-dependent F420 reductase